MDDGQNIVRDYFSIEGSGDIHDVLRDGEPLQNFWDLATGEK